MPEACGQCGRPSEYVVLHDRMETCLCGQCALGRSGFFGLETLTGGMQFPRRRSGPCPHCGTTVESIEATALVGCPLCYEVFAQRISEMR
jgi:protein-arginine kinase activator protein McsA